MRGARLPGASRDGSAVVRSARGWLHEEMDAVGWIFAISMGGILAIVAWMTFRWYRAQGPESDEE